LAFRLGSWEARRRGSGGSVAARLPGARIRARRELRGRRYKIFAIDIPYFCDYNDHIMNSKRK